MNRYCWVLLWVSSFGFGQHHASWGSYFSYNNIIGLTQSESRIIAATENAVFSKHLANHEIETFNSIDGLKVDKITTIHHSIEHDWTLVGNENGLLILINQNTKQVINKVDILNDIPVVSSLKKINHFTEHEGLVYISTDYGISVLNLSTLEFDDTFFIGELGQETKVLQTTVYNNEIYAVTEVFGIRRASLSNPFLVNYHAWETAYTGDWRRVATIGNHLVASSINGIVYRLLATGGTTPILNASQIILELKSTNDYLTAVTESTTYVLNENLATIAQVGQFFEEPLQFRTASVVYQTLYIGTSTQGVYALDLNNLNTYQNYIPAGPMRNKVYSVRATADNLWCVFGDNSLSYNPYNPGLGRYGISKLTPEGWVHIPYQEVLGATNLSRVTLHPTNENLAYIASNHTGVLQVENNIPVHLYNQTNTGQNGLEGFSGGNTTDVRVLATAFDRENNLWVTNSGNNKNIKRMNSSSNWQSFALPVIDDVTNYSDLVIDKNQTKWIATSNKGLVGFNEKHQNRTIRISDYENGLPYNHVFTIAVDNNNRLWIGTTWGVRVLPSVDRFLTEDQPRVNPIIIMEEGLAQELLYRQTVSKIKVDGADQKWLGTLGAGVFLVSPNGQETIHHFTKDNSPLPSNNILDIEINPKTGEVFFATDKGMVSYKGAATLASDDLSQVYVYPNPVRPEYFGTVKIAGLTDKANIKITDVEGNLVYEAKSEGGTIEWDTTAFGKYRVASGVYMIFITTEDATETKVKKVMIIR